MEKRGPKPRGIVKIKWSSNFAYAIGLLATDGCLSKDGRHIDFTSKDGEQIANFLKCLDISLAVGEKNSGLKKKAYRVQISDVEFCLFLNSIGLTKAKSLTIREVKIPDVFFFDFLRGCFDGDGSSYSYWDKRWKSSFMFYVSFASGSRFFAAWLRSTINRMSNLHGHISIHKMKAGKNPYYQLKYSKYEAMKLVDLIYKNPSCIRLSRKYLKIQESLGIVREHKGMVFVR